MRKDCIPERDAEFDQWYANFSTSVQEYLDELGLMEGDADRMLAAGAEWRRRYPAHITAEETAEGARAAKEAARAALEAEVRPLVARIQAVALAHASMDVLP